MGPVATASPRPRKKNYGKRWAGTLAGLVTTMRYTSMPDLFPSLRDAAEHALSLARDVFHTSGQRREETAKAARTGAEDWKREITRCASLEFPETPLPYWRKTRTGTEGPQDRAAWEFDVRAALREMDNHAKDLLDLIA